MMPPPTSHPKLLLGETREDGERSTFVLMRPTPTSPNGRTPTILGPTIRLVMSVRTLDDVLGISPKKFFA